MGRCIRFVVHQRVAAESRKVGLFTAAYWLLREGELCRHGHDRLADLLAWFEAELAIPPKGTVPSEAIFWYWDEGPFSERMWELAHLLNEYDFTTELVTAGFIGRIVYRDEHQIAAIPRKRPPR